LSAVAEYTAGYAQNTSRKRRADVSVADWASNMTGAASTDVV